MAEISQDNNWRDIACSRGDQFVRRVVAAAIGSLLVAAFVSVPLGVVSMVVIVVSQYYNERLWRPVADGTVSGSAREKLLMFGVAQGSLFFCIIPVSLWTIDNIGVRIFVAIWMAGGLLHATMHMHFVRNLWLACIVPFMIALISLPVYSLVVGDMSFQNAALILVAIFLHISHIVNAYETVSANAQEREAARLEALKQSEEALAANKAKSTFLATMSHEIRTPLNGVIGLSEILRDDDLPEKSANHIETIHGSGLLLLQLLNDILDFSKIEAGHLELESAPLNLDDIAKKTTEIHALKAREKGLTLVFAIADNVARRRMGDEYRIAQILHNLVSNAIKFTVNGGVEARIADDGRADWLRIEVSDTGIGMNEAQAERVLQPFAQADNTITRKFGGTGLGLSIVKGIVESMDGRIAVRSTVGEGTTITVALRLPEMVSEGIGAGATENLSEEQMDFSGLRVLNVDDNQVNRLVVTSFLSSIGATSIEADSGEAAISRIESDTFDLILMDIAMPGMDGVEAMQTIKNALGEDTPPIFAASAHAMRHEIDDYMAKGFDGYLTKPITRNKLRGALGQALALNEKTAQAQRAVGF